MQLPPMVEVDMAVDCHQGFDNGDGDGDGDGDFDDNAIKDWSNSTRLASPSPLA